MSIKFYLKLSFNFDLNNPIQIDLWDLHSAQYIYLDRLYCMVYVCCSLHTKLSAVKQTTRIDTSDIERTNERMNEQTKERNRNALSQSIAKEVKAQREKKNEETKTQSKYIMMKTCRRYFLSEQTHTRTHNSCNF